MNIDEEQLELGLDFGDPVSGLLNPLDTWDVIDEVVAERAAQDRKWGEQNLPFMTYLGGMQRPNTIKYASAADLYKKMNAAALAGDRGEVGWDTVLLEEVYEALELSGHDDVLYEGELAQVAAVAVAMIESNRRRRNAEASE